MTPRDRVRITVWSDYVCPFCYLEEPVLDRIRKEYAEQVEIEWRAFELRPDPVPPLDPAGEYLQTTWHRAVYPMAERRGMTLRLPPVQPRSRRALEAAEYAREQDGFDALHHGLFRAFFEDGRDLDDMNVLLDVARSAGLDPEGLRSALEEGRYTDKVRRDVSLAHEIGIAGVPAMLIGPADAPLQEAEIVSGAQPYERVQAAVERALRSESRRGAAGPRFRPGLPVVGD